MEMEIINKKSEIGSDLWSCTDFCLKLGTHWGLVTQYMYCVTIHVL